MATLSTDNQFQSWKLTPEEFLQGGLLTSLQKASHSESDRISSNSENQSSIHTCRATHLCSAGSASTRTD
jgi:hypothetical protein